MREKKTALSLSLSRFFQASGSAIYVAAFARSLSAELESKADAVLGLDRCDKTSLSQRIRPSDLDHGDDGDDGDCDDDWGDVNDDAACDGTGTGTGERAVCVVPARLFLPPQLLGRSGSSSTFVTARSVVSLSSEIAGGAPSDDDGDQTAPPPPGDRLEAIDHLVAPSPGSSEDEDEEEILLVGSGRKQCTL